MDEPCGCQNLNTIHIFYNVKKRTITFIHKCFMLVVSTGTVRFQQQLNFILSVFIFLVLKSTDSRLDKKIKNL